MILFIFRYFEERVNAKPLGDVNSILVKKCHLKDVFLSGKKMNYIELIGTLAIPIVLIYGLFKVVVFVMVIL